MTWSLKDLLDKADGPADIASIVVGASVGGTVDLVLTLHGVPTMGGAALLGAGYLYGLRQPATAYFVRRSRRREAEDQQLIEALQRERSREQALDLLSYASEELHPDD